LDGNAFVGINTALTSVKIVGFVLVMYAIMSEHPCMYVHACNEEPINLSSIIYVYYMYSSLGFRKDICLFFVHVSSNVFTVATLIALEYKE
jgi:hypothetical protein